MIEILKILAIIAFWLYVIVGIIVGLVVMIPDTIASFFERELKEE